MKFSRERITDYLFSIVLFSLTLVISNLVVTSLLFIIGYGISLVSILLTIVTSIVVHYFIVKNIFENNFSNIVYLKIIISFIVLFIMCSYLSNLFYDMSHDGKTYQQSTIIALKNGWNPVYKEIDDKQTDYIWSNHYPKGIWIPQASIYFVTNKIQYSKVFNILLMLTTFGFLLKLLIKLKKINLFYSIIICFGICFNPIFISQVFSFYIDSIIGNVFIAMFISIILFIFSKKNLYLMILMMSTILMTNLKFTGIVYAGVIFCAFLILIIRFCKEKLKTVILASIITGIVSILIVGFNPYITNTLAKGHPLYPLFGEGKNDIMTINTPIFLMEKNIAYKFLKSNFSEVSNNISLEKIGVHIPFSISIEELRSYGYDTRISGFGVFFGECLVLSLIIYIWIIINEWRSKNKKIVFLSLFTIGVIIGSTFSNPECWWARYVPQLWLILFMPSFIYCYTTYKNRIISNLIKLLYSLVIINMLITTSFIVFYIVPKNNNLNVQIKKLKNINKKVYFCPKEFNNNRLILIENNIEFTEVNLNEIEQFNNKVELNGSIVAFNK